MEDRDFIDFKFGDHWASDFNLLAVSSGDRYSPPVYGSVNSNTATIAGKVGVYKWKTQVNEKVFNIKIAFDNINGQILNQIKEWLNPFKIDKLVFKEEPYKYYWVALNTEPKLDFLPFLEETKVVNGIAFKGGVYKGEFELQFVCFDNYGYSDWQSFDENYDYVVKEIEGEEFISFNDGSDNNLIITKIGGNDSQETREGYNLLKLEFDKHKDYVNINDDGSFDIKNTSTSNIYPTIKNISLKAGTYTFLYEKNSNMPGVFIQRNNDGAYNFYLNSDVKYKQFTFDEDGVFRFEMAVSAGEEIKNVKLMLLKGAYAFDNQPTFEPYGASPSPEFESPVKTVGQNGSIEINVCNENFLDLNKYQFSEKDSIYNGGDIEVKNGIININAINATETVVAKSLNIKEQERIVLKPGTYRIYVNLNGFYDNTTFAQLFSGKVTINKDFYISQWFLDAKKGNTLNRILSISKEEKELTEYIPHQSQTKVLPIQQEMLEGDKFIKKDGKWCEAHYKSKMIFDGITNKLNGKINTTSNNLYYSYPVDDAALIAGNSIEADLLCNYFSKKTANKIYSNNLQGCALTIGKNISIGFGLDSEITTVELANAWLQEKNTAGNPLAIYYPLATPELIPCTPEQEKILDEMENNLYSYEGTNHIFSTDEVSPLLSISYVPKQDIYIEYVVNQSNLLNDSAFYYNNNIYKKSYFDAETGDATKSGISENRPVYLYNAGTTAANLNLTFDMIIPAEGSPLVINTESCKLTDNGVQVLKRVSSISISDFSKYKPFLEIYDGTPSNWQIQIDSNLCEVYLKHKTDKTKIISLNKFNDNQSFLSLTNCNFVDYSKPFPTLITAISGTALENTVFNKLSIGTSAQNYRLKNVDVEWKHTYL